MEHKYLHVTEPEICQKCLELEIKEVETKLSELKRKRTGNVTIVSGGWSDGAYTIPLTSQPNYINGCMTTCGLATGPGPIQTPQAC